MGKCLSKEPAHTESAHETRPRAEGGLKGLSDKTSTPDTSPVAGEDIKVPATPETPTPRDGEPGQEPLPVKTVLPFAGRDVSAERDRKEAFKRSVSGTSQVSDVPELLPGEQGAYEKNADKYTHLARTSGATADSAQEFPRLYSVPSGDPSPCPSAGTPEARPANCGGADRASHTMPLTAALAATPDTNTEASEGGLSQSRGRSGLRAGLPPDAIAALRAVDVRLLNTWDFDATLQTKGDALLGYTLAMFIGLGTVQLPPELENLEAELRSAAAPPGALESAASEANAQMALFNSWVGGELPEADGCMGKTARSESSDLSVRNLHVQPRTAGAAQGMLDVNTASPRGSRNSGTPDCIKLSHITPRTRSAPLSSGPSRGDTPDKDVLAARVKAACDQKTVVSTARDPNAAEASVVWEMLVRMRDMYNKVPYHNFYHVIDVTHAVYRFLSLCGPRLELCTRQRLAILTAAVAHDLKHPGTNNSYMVNSKSELAQRYSNTSVLENYHSDLLAELLDDGGANPFRGMGPEEEDAAQTLMRDAIMGTDMAGHFKMVGTVDAMVNEHAAMLESIPPDAPLTLGQAQTDYMLVVLLHMADISNAMKPSSISLKWAQLVMTEMFAQGDREKAEGLQVSMFCNRDGDPPAVMQMGFIEGIVAPLLTKLTRLLPTLRHTVPMLLATHLSWARKHAADLAAEQLPGSCREAPAPEGEAADGKQPDALEALGAKLSNFVSSLNGSAGMDMRTPALFPA